LPEGEKMATSSIIAIPIFFYPCSEDNDKEMGAITEEEAEKK
jgi:hypothetical protein